MIAVMINYRLLFQLMLTPNVAEVDVPDSCHNRHAIWICNGLILKNELEYCTTTIVDCF
jgi:hypothetical protein